jgi:hypothetical protein
VRTGRNDPCPCGSGKKYKKCCLAKDEAAQRVPAPSPPAAPVPTPVERTHRELSPEEQWWNEFFEQAGATEDADEAAALVQKALDEGPPTSGDVLLESIEPLLEAIEDAERMALIEKIEARFPEASRDQIAYFARMRFASAMERDDVDLVEEARRFGPHVVKVIDLVAGLPSRLAWEGRVQALRAFTSAAWPAVRDSDELMDWAVEEWAGKGLGALLLDHLEREPDLDSNNPTLLADLAPFEEGGAEPGAVRAFARRWIALLEPKGELPVDAALLARAGRKDDADSVEQLNRLAAQVASRLRSRNGWSRSQAWVMLREMACLVADCADHRRGKGKSQSPASVVLPPHQVFRDRLLKRNVGMFSRDIYTIAAVTLALPAWAGEVAARGWVSEAEAANWLRQYMRAMSDILQEVPVDRRTALEQRLVAFTEGEGREVMR